METTKTNSVFETLNKIDCTAHIEKKKNGTTELSYLSWPWAWAEVKKRYPDADYTIWKDEQQRPYFEDADLGLMCYTTVTIAGQTHEMWLPVMDGANKAMRRAAYSYETKLGQKKVDAVTMFDVNKTIMRCLVKNLAMFGLGLYIYAGEDLPEDVAIEKATKKQSPTAAKQPTLPAQQTPAPKQPEHKADQPPHKLEEVTTAIEMHEMQMWLDSQLQSGKMTTKVYDNGRHQLTERGKQIHCTYTDTDGWVADADLYGSGEDIF